MRAVTWIVALGIAAYPFDNPWSIGERIFGDLGSSIGIFILMALSFTISKGPAHSIGHWLGKISFSLYLNHYFILNACIILLHKQFGAVAVWICTIGTSMLLAAIMHAAVESPSQHLARRLRRRLAFQRRSTIAQS
ncbi:hypothetical protein WS68_09860 [Burkholderia sp. TSV86]|nr:hypothetical protein WS68_09860 [Burkholderia sp. TSV86]